MASLSDAELLALARQARTGDGFRQLYDAGCLDAHDGDHSRANLALFGMLAFWTDGDPARIDELFRQFALMRPKWDERHAADGSTCGEMKIRKALGEVWVFDTHAHTGWYHERGTAFLGRSAATGKP